MNRQKVVVVASSIMTIKAFMLPHIEQLTKDYDVTVVVNESEVSDIDINGLKVRIVHCPIVRNISPLKDVKSLIKLRSILKKLKPDVVHSISPKAGLVAMMTSKWLGIRCRLHMFTGQVWVTKSGFVKYILRFIDKIIAKCTTHTLVDSESQKIFLLEERVVRFEKTKVLGAGSVCGVDLNRFRFDLSVRNEIRNKLDISLESVVFLCLGRLKKDKGILDLVTSFMQIVKECPASYLLIVGPDEEQLKPIIQKMAGLFSNQVIFIDFTTTPESYMSAADVICLPSYREGFGSVIIEAAAVGVPALASNIYGITDAVSDGNTGLLHTPGNVSELSGLMKRMINDETLVKTLGKNAKKRAMENFSEKLLVEEMRQYYLDMLNIGPVAR